MSWLLSAGRQLLRHGRSAAPGAVVLGYHDVVTDDPGDYQVDAELLDHQLSTVSRLGMRFVSATELINRLSNGAAVDGCAVVTFDDALMGVHRAARAVLRDHGVSATIFVVSGHLGVDPPWWKGQQRTMNIDELLDLVGDGHEIGSHTINHPSLVSLGFDQLMTELADSRRSLEELTGTAVELLAYPSGHHDQSVRSVAHSTGYRAGFTFLNGRVDGGTDPFRLPRLTIGPHVSPRLLAAQLLRAGDTWPNHQVERVADR